jgi:predicted secreted protein
MRLRVGISGCKWIFAVLLILLCGVLPCRGEDGETGTAVTVGPADNGREISLKKGDVLQIELRSHVTAGYSWYFENFDKERLEMISKEAKAESNRMGAPVLGIWRLRAKTGGTAKIRMHNYRVWEGKEKSVNQFFLDIRIE